MRISLTNCENCLIGEIGNLELTRLDIAKTYALALVSVENEEGSIDWARVNRAIIDRWSSHALEWIKRQAWSGRCYKDQMGGTTDG